MEIHADETDWRLLGQLARARRERLGLKQGDLSHYGGPGGTTVGKIERAEQRNFPPRTRQQLEKALGWNRGTVDSILMTSTTGWKDDPDMMDDFVRQLVEDDLPDLTTPADAGRGPAGSARDLTDEELLAELTYRMRRYAALALEGTNGQSTATKRAGGSPALTISDEAQHLSLEELQREASRPLADGTPG